MGVLSRRRFLQGSLALASLGLLAGCGALPPHVAPPAQLRRIGLLSAAALAANADRVEAFRQGLRELGYVEGKDIVIEYRYVVGEQDRLRDLATELVGLNVDVIVATGPTSTLAAKEATSAIPIVMTYHSDPVGSGVVASLAHPGGNITGLSSLSPTITAKQLEIIKETLPGLSCVSVFGTSSQPGNAQALLETETAARSLGVQIQYTDTERFEDIEMAFRESIKKCNDATLMITSPILNAYRTQIIELTANSRLPAIYPYREFVEEGGLMSYGASFTALYHRAGYYVDRILKGAKPADLPVEQPMVFDFVVNMKTARTLDTTFPPEILLQVTEVIE